MPYILQLSMLPFCRFDQHTYYTVQVQTSDVCFEVHRQFVEFYQFSQKLQQLLPKDNKVPKLRKDHIANFLKNNQQKHHDRQKELKRFVEALLSNLPQSILESELFLNFFSVIMELSQPSHFKHMFSLRRNSKPENVQPSHYFTVNDTCMTPHLQESEISTASSRSSTSTFGSTHSFDEEEEELIKLKIVYDSQNIVIIRVSRCISLDALRSIILQKFALLDIQLPKDLTLMATGNRCSASSICAADIDPKTTTFISTDDELQNMQLKWSCRQKITLRCITNAM